MFPDDAGVVFGVEARGRVGRRVATVQSAGLRGSGQDQRRPDPREAGLALLTQTEEGRTVVTIRS